MPALHNPNRTLRFCLDVADFSSREHSFVCTAAVEFFDRRDDGFWPFLRLPVLSVTRDDALGLVEAIRGVCSRARPGFSLRTGALNELSLQLGREGEAFAVEVGVDLAPYLLETSGIRSQMGTELSLFRFGTTLTELVVFADAIASSLLEVEGRAHR